MPRPTQNCGGRYTPMYEYGRIARLAEKLREAGIAPEIAGRIMAGGEAVRKSTSPEKKAAWLGEAMRRMDQLLPLAGPPGRARSVRLLPGGQTPGDRARYRQAARDPGRTNQGGARGQAGLRPQRHPAGGRAGARALPARGTSRRTAARACRRPPSPCPSPIATAAAGTSSITWGSRSGESWRSRCAPRSFPAAGRSRAALC